MWHVLIQSKNERKQWRVIEATSELSRAFSRSLWPLNGIIWRTKGGSTTWQPVQHYIDVIMTTMTSQITSLTVVYSTVYSDAVQRKHQSSASQAFVWGSHRDRWIPRTKGQLRGKCFHLMTSSWLGWKLVYLCSYLILAKNILRPIDNDTKTALVFLVLKWIHNSCFDKDHFIVQYIETTHNM